MSDKVTIGEPLGGVLLRDLHPLQPSEYEVLWAGAGPMPHQLKNDAWRQKERVLDDVSPAPSRTNVKTAYLPPERICLCGRAKPADRARCNVCRTRRLNGLVKQRTPKPGRTGREESHP